VLIFATILTYALPTWAVIQFLEVRGANRIQRLVLCVVVSLVALPASLFTVGSLLPFIPDLLAVLIFSAILASSGFLLRRFGLQPTITLEPDFAGPAERWLAFALITIFTLIVSFGRIVAIFRLWNADNLIPFDESWHLAQVVSVARTGIPAGHYLFPHSPIAYYYGSWIYPAILTNFPGSNMPAVRALSIHGIIQVWAFISLAWMMLATRLRHPLGRWLGLLCITVAGGLDTYVLWPQVGGFEWWQRNVPWLQSSHQISSFFSLYIWVPQHLAGGMAFILTLFLWHHTRAKILIKATLSGICLGFSLLTSPFVALSSGLSAVFTLFFYRRQLWRLRLQITPFLVLAASLALLIAWRQIKTYLGHPAGFIFDPIRVPLLQFLLGGSASAEVLRHCDSLLTLIAFPLVGSLILVIEFGLLGLLYITALLDQFLTRRKLDGFGFQTLTFPPFYLFLMFLFHDEGGGDNFGMRGFIPAQILIVLAALQRLETLANARTTCLPIRPRLWLGLGPAIVILIAQSVVVPVSLLASRRPHPRVSKYAASVISSSPTFPPELAYIRWMNENTPSNAILLEASCPDDNLLSDPNIQRYHWLERLRLIPPDCFASSRLATLDGPFLLPKDFQPFRESTAGQSILDIYSAIDFPLKAVAPAYLLVRQSQPTPRVTGIPVYTDPFVKIYRLKELP
jgi:hypothetical protein